MKTLSDVVHIERRFARSARIDADLKGTPPLVGYLLQETVKKALMQLAVAQAESAQGAFTWTGPYGGGKSSAALLVGNLVGGGHEGRSIARKIAGKELTDAFEKAFPERGKPWVVVPVTGSRSSISEAIRAAAAKSLGWAKADQKKAATSDASLASALVDSARRRSGVLLLIDELGKFLEHAVTGGGDVHVLQELAEYSSRSDGRLVVIGVLHQAFQQYAGRLTRGTQLEWAKVQGRFQDISFLTAVDETVALLGRAIEARQVPKSVAKVASTVATLVSNRRPTDVTSLKDALAATWPLNPISALMLGPVSRQRFAQNERSVFGFLTSSEPHGFLEFLKSQPSDADVSYGPERLWDYLHVNFSVALSGGQDGARYSLAVEAIDRAAAKGGAVHVALAKTAAVIELFRNGSGVAATEKFLQASLPDFSPETVTRALTDLVDWAVVLPRPRLGDFAIFAGSDFELDSVLDRERSEATADELASLPARVGLSFAVAKRHYFRTGALRAFSIVLHRLAGEDSPNTVAARLSNAGKRGTGMMVLLMADPLLPVADAESAARALTKVLKEKGVVAAVAVVPSNNALGTAASELFALERIAKSHPQLEGDRIARREIAARASKYLHFVRAGLAQRLDEATWLLTHSERTVRGSLSAAASKLADVAFPRAPILKSELVQRDLPSSNAAAAVRELGHAMVMNGEKENLDITGYPPEMGLYLTLLKAPRIHRKVKGSYRFIRPDTSSADAEALQPAWDVMDSAADSTLEDIYQLWAAPPYGIKRGVMPILAMANILSRQDEVALYMDGVFQPQISDLIFDKLLQDPKTIRLRRAERNSQETRLLTSLAKGLALDESATALRIAQALFQRFEALPAYAQKTSHLSGQAKEVRDVVLKSNDPEALLFGELPKLKVAGDPTRAVIEALEECEGAYPKLLLEVVRALTTAVGVDPKTFSGISKRADAIRGLTNDLRFDAFAMRAASFEDGSGDVEGLAGMLVHKPVMTWSDRDREQSFLELARFGRLFREAEALAVVRNRPSSTEAVAIIVGVNPKAPALIRRFELTEQEKRNANRLATKLLSTISADSAVGIVRLAALARAVEDIAADVEPS